MLKVIGGDAAGHVHAAGEGSKVLFSLPKWTPAGRICPLAVCCIAG